MNLYASINAPFDVTHLHIASLCIFGNCCWPSLSLPIMQGRNWLVWCKSCLNLWRHTGTPFSNHTQEKNGSVEGRVQIRWRAFAGACGQAEEEGEVVFTNLGRKTIDFLVDLCWFSFPTLQVPVVLPLLGGYWCNTNQIQSGYLTITWEPGTCWNQEINEINWIFRFFQVLEWS